METVIVIVLAGVALFIIVQLFRTATATDDREDSSRNTGSVAPKGRRRGAQKHGRKKATKKGRHPEAVAKTAPVEQTALPKVAILEGEELELTMITLPSLAMMDEDTLDSALPPSSEPNVIPIVYDENADVDVPTDAASILLLSAVGQSEQGRRKRNEDRYLVLEDPPLYAVADGMGGYAGGDVAAKMTVDILEEVMREPHDDESTQALPKRAARLVRGVTRANFDVFEKANADTRYAEMGTTLVCARFSTRKRRVYIAHVGDSRCYVYRDGKIHQITRDHTVAELHGIGGSAGRRLVRAIGVQASTDIDLILGQPNPGDRYLLCSDGLCRGLSDDEIGKILGHFSDPNEAVDELIRASLEGGTKDNVTVIIVNVESAAGGARAEPSKLGVAS